MTMGGPARRTECDHEVDQDDEGLGPEDRMSTTNHDVHEGVQRSECHYYLRFDNCSVRFCEVHQGRLKQVGVCLQMLC